MADGDDREESDNQRDDANLPQVGHLHIGEPEESDNLEEVVSEYMALDSQLNQIDACLDSLEARNDDLLSKLKAFLQTSQSPPEEDDDKDNETGDDGSNSGEGAGAKEGSKDSEASSTSCSS